MDTYQETVAISSLNGGYPSLFPYDPDEEFPEYCGNVNTDVPNPVYRAIRNNFRLLGYDKAHFGTPEWNPLGEIISPGDRVFIKPNLCSHEYGRKKENLFGDLFSVITHPSLVRAVADYVAIALKNSGEIFIGDNPTIDTNFAKLLDATQLQKLTNLYRDKCGVRCEVRDLRNLWCDDVERYGNKTLMKDLPGDPEGDTIVNLGNKSFFYGLNSLLFRGVFTNRRETIRHHHGKVQEYAVANSIYQSDVYISIPKLKTHHKVGATLNIKGLVGMCTRKNYLVHWRIGFPSWGGDEYPEPKRAVDHLLLAIKHLYIAITPERLSAYIGRRFNKYPIKKYFEISPYRGSWEGNDTCWRMAADLYLTLMSRERKCLSVIDGVVGGDHNGPFLPSRKEARIIVSGENLVYTDAVAVRMMDFEIEEIRYITGLLKAQNLDLAKVRIITNDFDVTNFFTSKRPYLNFTPPSGWPHLAISQSKQIRE